MPIPDKSDLLTGKFSSDGSPFVQVASKDTIDLDTLEYSWDGSPWYGIEDSSAPPVVEEFVPIVMWFLEI